MHPPSLSRISPASTSSFPQALLNPVSPQQSPLGGLEALVQAAVVERDRLEAKASLDRKADASRSTVRRSPELFRSSHESSRTHLQAPAPRTPITPSLISGPLLRDSYSESSLRTGPGPEAHPSKRQRPSDPHPGPDHSWDSPPSWDSSSQLTGLIGPGIKPRRRSSDVRTEMRPTIPIPSWDKEEVSVAASRVSPTRERSARRRYSTEEKSSRSHVPSHGEPVTSTIFAPDDIQHVFAAAEESRLKDSRPNIDLHPPPKALRSDLLLEKHDPPLSPPPPRSVFKLAEPPVPTSPAPRLQSPPPAPVRDDRYSPQAHPLRRNDTPAPTATVEQNFVEMETAASLEQSMDSTVPILPPLPGPSVALVESLPPDNLPTIVQDSPVFITSSSIPNVHDDHLDPAVPVKSQSPPPPSPGAHDTDIALATKDVQSPVGTSRLSLPLREDVPNPPSSEQEPRLPPTTASSSPRAVSPITSSFQDVVSTDQPVRPHMSSASETSHVTLATDLQNLVDAPMSVTSVGEPEAVKSPVTFPSAVEPVPPPKPDGSPRVDEAPIPVVNVIKSEAAQELDVAMDANQTHDTEQRDTDMDVDEELLSLIADDLPSRHSQNMLRKQELSPSEVKHFRSSHAHPKPEPVLSTLPPSHPSPGLSSFTIKSEGVSTLSPDAAAFTRDPEANALKAEERPPQKKKAKQHPQPKSRTKPSGSAKSKLKVSSDGLLTAPSKSKKSSTAVTKSSTVAVRSRSTSVMPVSRTPGPENRPPGEAELDEAEEGMEDKLYCICKTRYDDERVMIACDRCDEWYHTSCVNMPDLQIDLVDQFICPLCVEKNPHLDLRTTWKRRCLNGLKQHDPNSPDACHKPARGAFSKYCSDECGVQYMHMRISLWVENGGNRDRLWETVKSAERREGVVVSARALEGQSRSPSMTGDQAKLPIIPPNISKADRELARLRARLETLVQTREALKIEMNVIAWREKVTELAIQHADTIEQCGWDQRLCFGEEEVAEFGASVLESYEENNAQADVDETQEEAEWWCTGKKKCDRHSGWQKLRVADVEFDKETKDQALQQLTKLEREIRKRVEDILDPQAHLDKAKMLEPSSPRVPLLSSSTLNGQPKHKPNGDQTKKGKKRKE